MKTTAVWLKGAWWTKGSSHPYVQEKRKCCKIGGRGCRSCKTETSSERDQGNLCSSLVGGNGVEYSNLLSKRRARSRDASPRTGKLKKEARKVE